MLGMVVEVMNKQGDLLLERREVSGVTADQAGSLGPSVRLVHYSK